VNVGVDAYSVAGRVKGHTLEHLHHFVGAAVDFAKEVLQGEDSEGGTG
jgi:hypothetical protein